jgi:hypothetical protein
VKSLQSSWDVRIHCKILLHQEHQYRKPGKPSLPPQDYIVRYECSVRAVPL